jgi:hypothetical protein
MKRKIVFALAASALAPTRAAAQLPWPTKSAITIYLSTAKQFRFDNGEPLDNWQEALVRALGTTPPDQAAVILARPFGLSAGNMRELVRLWLYSNTDFDRPDDSSAQIAELSARFVALAARTGHAPLVMEAAASSLSLPGHCPDPRIIDRLMAGTTDPGGDAWRMATASGLCPSLYARFAAAAPDRTMPALFALITQHWLKPGEELPVLAYMASPAGLERVDPAHRELVGRFLTRAYLNSLLGAGLGARAIALFESLDAGQRAALLAGAFPGIRAEADGLPITIGEDRERSKPDQSLMVSLAAAYALAGRTGEAERLLAAAGDVRDARNKLACRYEPAPSAAARPCAVRDEMPGGLLLLDHFLHRQGEDPYPLAETLYAGSMSPPAGGIVAELECRVFADANYHSICQQGRDGNRRRILQEPVSADEAKAAKAVIASARLPGYDSLRPILAGELAVVAARSGADADQWISFREQPPVDPDPPPFAPLAIPAGMRGAGAPMAWSKSFAALPEGYEPVRVAREGERVAVVSVSQNYDPTGEVTRGGYWIHLSEDGGKHWRRPLYTGLAERFPYLVVPNPRLPLFDGKVLNLAVEVKLLDTRSITYPPVGLGTRRSQGDLYLRIPIAALERDSDGDGLTDLAARHLLLAPNQGVAPGSTAYLVGAAGDSNCSVQSAPEREAMQAVLTQIFSMRTGAVIEPVDRDPAHPIEASLAAAGHIDPNSADRPIFIDGDPADYECLKPDRLMIVYRAADMVRLRRMTPDFHAVELDKIIFDRARDRGYVGWSTGWSGGTFRLRRVGATWSLDTISSWIT